MMSTGLILGSWTGVVSFAFSIAFDFVVILVFKELPGGFVGTAPVVCEVTLGVEVVSVLTVPP